MATLRHLLLCACIGAAMSISPAGITQTVDKPVQVSVQVLKASLSKSESVTLSLVEALRMATDENPALKAAQNVVDEARARYYTRLAQMLPDLEATYIDSHYQGGLQVFGNDVFIISRSTSQPQLLFRFPVFQGGRRFFQVRSARKTLEAEKHNRQSTLQDTLRRTALSYYELKRRLEVIAIAQKQLEETQAQLEINQARMEAGTGTRLDVLQSQAQVARANQQLLEAVKNSQIAALRLNEILDLPAFVSVVPHEIGQQMQTLVPLDKDFNTLLHVARENRPELKVLANQIKALTELRRVAWSAVLPEISVMGRIGGVGPSLGDIKRYDETGLSLAFTLTNLSVPALTLYRENTAQIQRLQHQLEARINTLERELSEAYLEALTKQAEVGVARQELEASRQALADAIERLEAGVGRNIDVLDAQTRLTQARTNLSATILDYNQAQVNLVYYLGLATVDTLTQGLQLP